MDWTKAKTIIIIALLCTNLFLLFTYGKDRFRQQRIPEEKTLQKVLKENNIFLKVSVPEKQVKMPVLSVRYEETDPEETARLIREKKYSVEMPGEDRAYREAAEEAIRELGFEREGLSFEKIIQKGNLVTVCYNNTIDQIKIEKSYICCDFRDGILTEVRRHWLDPVETSRRKLETIPAKQALARFINQNEHRDKKIVINRMELVFWLDETSFDGEAPVRDTALPAWKIEYNNGRVKYIYAFEAQ